MCTIIQIEPYLRARAAGRRELVFSDLPLHSSFRVQGAGPVCLKVSADEAWISRGFFAGVPAWLSQRPMKVGQTVPVAFAELPQCA